MNITRSRILASFLIGLVLTFVLQVRPFSAAAPFRFVIKVRSDVAGRARLIWRPEHRTPPRFAPNTDTMAVRPGEQVLAFNLQDTDYGTFRLGAKPIEAVDAFRLNPLDHAGHVVLGTAVVIGPEGEIVATYQPSAFIPASDGLVLKRDAASAACAVQPSDGIFIQPPHPLALRRITVPLDPVSAALEFAAASLAAFLIFLLAGRTPAVARARLAGWGARVRDDLATRPGAVILITAMLATAASCHPVVFCGRSFVSLNNWPVAALYGDHPESLAIAQDGVEPSRGSDMGATMWAHLPYSVMQHRAIFDDGELPLWNRHTYCGAPLLAQGQSMLGDPLHWIAIAGDGASWAWDVKFCVAKLLFSLGVGLLAFAATRRVWVSALLAASASFIGFFAWKFNHCAFFSVSYAPWILLCWLRAATTERRVWPWACGIALANFWELNSGTAKESAMLIACLNLTGALLVLTAGLPWRARLSRLGLMALGNVLFVMLSAPHWMVFLDALRFSWTTYESPPVKQLQPGLVLGLFDDLFFSQAVDGEGLVNPALNFLVLLGCLWAALDVRRLLREKVFVAVLLGALLPAAMVFGVVPPDFIAGLPFIGNIEHVANTFSCVLIIHLLVLAAFGLRSLWDRAAEENAAQDLLLTAAMMAVALGAYFGFLHATHAGIVISQPRATVREVSGFFLGCAPAIIVAMLALPWAVRGLRRQPTAAHVLAAALALFLIHFRHGMWTETKFDNYVMNAKPRTNLALPSPAVAMVRGSAARRGEPSRTSGFERAVAPGFNAVLGLDHLSGADALVPRWQRELVVGTGLPLLWGWRPAMARTDFPAAKTFGDLWNVRWYLGPAGETPRDVPGLRRMAALDLEVHESPTAWPRAFFTDRLAECASLENFIALVKASDGRPFAAAVPEKTSDIPPAKVETIAERTVVPAGGYRLTENTTTFTIEAPSPGVVVLGDSYEPGNWRVTLDGHAAEYFRVNHAFLGVRVPAAGAHTLHFRYWPRLLTPALWIFLCGALGLLGMPVVCSLRARRAGAADGRGIPGTAQQ